jgi:uncharacterized protein RhaS with RHS repeats
MYSYKARIYSPTLGRFLQTDPAGYVDGPNWYNNTGSDPVNRTDPSGMFGYPGDDLNNTVIIVTGGRGGYAFTGLPDIYSLLPNLSIPTFNFSGINLNAPPGDGSAQADPNSDAPEIVVEAERNSTRNVPLVGTGLNIGAFDLSLSGFSLASFITAPAEKNFCGAEGGGHFQEGTGMNRVAGMTNATLRNLGNCYVMLSWQSIFW